MKINLSKTKHRALLLGIPTSIFLISFIGLLILKWCCGYTSLIFAITMILSTMLILTNTGILIFFDYKEQEKQNEIDYKGRT